MASCVGCKKRTTSFCFVHKQSVCDDDLFLKTSGAGGSPNVQCNSICVIGNYFDWLADSDFTFPPKCTLCNRTLQADPSTVIRLVCKCLHHRACLKANLIEQMGNGTQSKDLKCPSCSALLVDTATQQKTKLRDSVVAFVGSLSRSDARTTNNQSSSNAQQDDAYVMVPPVAASSSSSSSSILASPPAVASSFPAPHSSPHHSTHAVPRATALEERHGGGGSNISNYAASSSSSSSSRDIESQQQQEDTSKTKKPNRFFALRNAGQAGWKRWCRPQRIVIITMVIAFLLVVFAYIKFSVTLMKSGGPPSEPPPQLSAEIINAD